jgi:hypothetical protein
VWFAVCASLGFSAPLAAQEDRPQIMAGERKVSRKKDAGPRALAVLQLGEKGKSSLVPVAILINGRFYDASAYKANPVPMALESGTVYEAERAGDSLGLFTVGAALHSNAANAEIPWLGTGEWVPAGSEAPKKGMKAENVPVGIEPTDAPPKLTRGGGGAPKQAPAANAPSGNAPPSSSPPANAPSSGDERPRLSKPSESGAGGTSGSDQGGQGQPPQASSGQGSSGQGSSGSNPEGDSKSSTKPAEGKPADKKDEPANINIPVSDSGTGEANRPRLRRGKPIESFADEQIPGYSRPGESSPSAPSRNTTKTSDPAAPKSNVQLIPAISDAGGPDPRPYTYEWANKDDQDQRRQQITALAKDEFRKYLSAQAKASITPQPASPKPSRRTAAAKMSEPLFENTKLTAYDVWGTNQPVLILSAEAHMPPQPQGSSGVDSDLRYSVLIVAYPDMYNTMHKIYAGITDKYHLDVTPRLELVDAVDADGDGRGELLFREVSDAGSGWAIYRPAADTLWKMFDSLNPE